MGKQFDPDAFLKETSPQIKSSGSTFDPDKFILETGGPKPQSSGPSKTVSAIRQGMQGFTGGLSDEFAGGVEAAGRVVGINGAGGPLMDMSLNDDGPTISGDELLKSYKKGRDVERDRLKEDWEANPKTSFTSNLVGGVASPINKVTKGMGVVKAGATLGGVYGFGSSDADNVTDLALDTGKGALVGGVTAKGFDKIGKAIAPAITSSVETGAYKISQPMAKINKDEIIAAADRIGLKVTPGMLDDTGFVERLESTLAKSPSYLGQKVAASQRAVTDKLRDTTQQLTEEATNMSPYQVGEKFKSGVTAKVGERLDPISAVFNEVAESTKSIPISDRSKNAIIKNISNLDTYALTGGAGKPAQYVDMIGRLKNADQVKTAMTMLNADIKASMGAEKQVLIGIKEKLSTLEENSITRAAISQAREGGMKESDLQKAYHGTFSEFAEESIRPSKGGRYGEGFYLTKDKTAARNYGDRILDYNVNSSKVLDVTDPTSKSLSSFAKNQGFEIKTSSADPYSSLLSQVRKKFPNEDLVGTNANKKLAQLLKDDGFEGIQFSQNDSNTNMVLFDRANIKTTGEMSTSVGKQIGRDIVGDLRDARKNYRGLLGDLGELSENARIKTNKGPSAFLDSVEQIPSERIQDKFFNVENNRALTNLQEKFPEQFDLLRQGKLKEIADAAVDNTVNGQGRVSSQRFLNEVRKLNPEAKQMIFKGAGSVVDDVSTIQQSLPRNFNPSGTASELGWKDSVIQNVKDVPTYLMYKGASSNLGKAVGGVLDGPVTTGLRDVSASATKSLSNPAARYSGSETVTKSKVSGFDKWANDGANKIKEHDSSVDPEIIEKAKRSKKGREMLIKASDLKPGSKAMDKLFGEIKEEGF